MKFVNLKDYQNYLETLLDTNEMNLSISDMLTALVGARDITDKKEIESLVKSSHYQEKDIFMSRVAEYLDFDLSFEDNEEIFEKYIADIIEPLDISKYLNNPYYQLFKDLKVKDKDYELVTDKYVPYELFAYQDMSTFEGTYIEKNSLGYFKDEYPFLALNKRDVTWMSVTPNEIETMEASINQVKGDVVVFGLGLGYFAFMASLKPEVKKITIIENDKNVISLFNKYIYPKFPHKEKIEIKCMDALEYINSQVSADYAFVDLWHDPYDGLELFLKFKAIENKSNCKFLYWLESSFYLLLRRCMLSLIAEQLEGYNDANYKISENVNDKIINKYYFTTKNLTISSRADLSNLLSDKTLIDLLLNH